MKLPINMTLYGKTGKLKTNFLVNIKIAYT